MHASTPTRETPAPRVQVRCAGIDASDVESTSISSKTEELLRNNADGVTLAVVNISRRGHGPHHCDTQLFGRELEHVAGYAEHADPVVAAIQSVARALRALKTSERHNPWTSSHPGCQRGQARGK